MSKYYLILLSLLFTNAHANLNASASGSTITWPDTGGWMQVINTANWQGVSGCEGYIDACPALAPGKYDVIDHTSDTRQKGIIVTGNTTVQSSATVFAAPVQSSAFIIRNSCSHEGFKSHANCTASCPSGTKVKRVVACRAKQLTNNDELIFTDFDSDENAVYCRAGVIHALTTITAGVECE